MDSEECSQLLLETVPEVMRAMRAEMWKADAGEFTIPQLRILAKLSREPGHSNKDLSEWMGVRAATMSKMIDKLVKRTYVRRETLGSDRRQTLLRCTVKGRNRALEIRKNVHKALAVRVSSISEEKRQKLAECLQTLKELFP